LQDTALWLSDLCRNRARYRRRLRHMIASLDALQDAVGVRVAHAPLAYAG
jgi:hypothetical protein